MDIRDRMKRLCSRREYCVADVRRKILSALDGDVRQTEAVIEELVREKYVDDVRYASAFARDKAFISGWGKEKIRYMLRSKGVAGDIIDEAVSGLDSDKADRRLEKLLEVKYRALKGDSQCRIKMLRFALGRGYHYDEASRMIDELIQSV